jgi:hypothetical protein
MKKKGPQRSQSLSAFPGSSLFGFGNTTSLRLLTILDRSRFTVSQTGSVRVFGGDPNPSVAIVIRLLGTALGLTGAVGTTVMGMEGGTEDGGVGEVETGTEMGMVARGGDGGRAGRTVAEGAA